jgi:nucleoside-diphosphate-sugar epimerase
MKQIKIAITGASGYLGSEIIRRCGNLKLEVLALQRTPSTKIPMQPYHLEDGEITIPADQTPSVIIHLAADTKNTLNDKVETRAMEKLLHYVRTHHVHLLYASSVNAIRPVSEYGRRKATLERSVIENGFTAVRIGFVYGGRQGKGIFGLIERLVRIFPVLPDIRPSPWIQPIHLTDAADGLIALSLNNPPPGSIITLAASSVKFTDFLRNLASYRLGVIRFFLPLPRIIFYYGCRMMPGARAESIQSLLNLPVAASELEQLGIKPVSMETGMRRSLRPSRKEAILEARTLLRHASGKNPSYRTIRHYLREHPPVPALPIPLNAWQQSCYLADLESQANPCLQYAFSCAEFSSSLAKEFLPISPSLLRSVAVLAQLGWHELRQWILQNRKSHHPQHL